MYQEPGLVLIGPGGVGSKVLEQLIPHYHSYSNVVVADSQHGVAGLSSGEDLAKVLHAKRNGGLQSLDMELVRKADLAKYFLRGSIVINAMPTVFSADGLAGGETAASVMYDIEALSRGAHVVPAHKSAFGNPALYERVRKAASESGAMYIPAGVLMGPTRAAELLEWLNYNNIGVASARGIVNGTTSNMLSKIGRDGASYEDALQEQIRLGNAEKPNGEKDVRGYDALTKMRVMAIISGKHGEGQLFGLEDSRSSLPASARKKISGTGHLGIEGITAELMQELKSEGLAIKLVGSYDGINGNIQVGPMTLPLDDPLVLARDINNILVLNLEGKVNVNRMVSDVYSSYTSLQSDETGIQRHKVITEYPIASNNGLRLDSFTTRIDYDPRTNQLTIEGPGAGAAETAAGLLGAVERIRRELSNKARVREDKPMMLASQDSM